MTTTRGSDDHALARQIGTCTELRPGAYVHQISRDPEPETYVFAYVKGRVRKAYVVRTTKTRVQIGVVFPSTPDRVSLSWRHKEASHAYATVLEQGPGPVTYVVKAGYTTRSGHVLERLP